jgi:hypothetical protein
MTFDWQNIVVAVVVAGAAWYVGSTLVGMWRGRKGSACGGCGTCSAAKDGVAAATGAPSNLVSVESLRPKR